MDHPTIERMSRDERSHSTGVNLTQESSNMDLQHKVNLDMPPTEEDNHNSAANMDEQKNQQNQSAASTSTSGSGSGWTTAALHFNQQQQEQVPPLLDDRSDIIDKGRKQRTTSASQQPAISPRPSMVQFNNEGAVNELFDHVTGQTLDIPVSGDNVWAPAGANNSNITTNVGRRSE